jgi:hypothetical protein
MSVKSRILQEQRDWATALGLEVDSRGYLSSYQLNLFQPLNQKSLDAFTRGSGSELKDTPRKPAKMRALHSSSALAVNVFGTWVDRNASPLLSVLNLEPGEVDVHFEEQFPTGLPGNPPNLDVVLRRPGGQVIAIESKFTEWLTRKAKNGPPLKDKYFPNSAGVWEQVGLPRTQQFAEALQAREVIFRHLDATQLIKHSLGLATQLGRDFSLLYVFYDADGVDGEAHWSEISIFKAQIGSEFGFQAISYQQAFSKLAARHDVPEEYLSYLKGRYFSGDRRTRRSR